MGHKSADDYREARRNGDDQRCAEIVSEVTARFATRTTDGSEMAELYRANVDTPLAKK